MHEQSWERVRTFCVVQGNGGNFDRKIKGSKNSENEREIKKIFLKNVTNVAAGNYF